MKKTFFILLFMFFTADSISLFSQVNQAVLYFPLKVGNVWVYNCSAYSNPPVYSCSCILRKYRFQVTGTIIKNSKTYFLIQSAQSNYQCGGCYAPPYGDTLRIDSVTGNIYKYSLFNGCSNSPFEILFDSLNAKLNDTVKNNCGVSQWRYRCSDTSNQNVLGTSRKTKYFNEPQFESSYSRRFAQGIGMVNAGMTFVSCGQNFSTLVGCVIDGILYGDTSMLVGLNQISSEVPSEFSLLQNYPNPFNPTTRFGFRIAEFGLVRLTVFDVLGKEIHVLVNQELSPGTYEVDLDGSDLPSGVYYYRLEAEKFIETKKMVLIK